MRVVDFEEELKYMAKASQPLKDIAQVILDTGLRPEEVFRIRIENLDFDERTIFNPFGKTKAARRPVTMTSNVAELLQRRAKKAKDAFVFPAKGKSFQALRFASHVCCSCCGRGCGSADAFSHPWTHEHPNDNALRASS